MGALNPQDQGGGDNAPPSHGGPESALDRPRGLWGKALGLAEDLLVMLSALAVAGMGFYVVAGVVMRNVLNMSLHDESVVVGELMIAALVLPLGKVAAERSFITVDVLTQRFQNRHAIVLNALACVVGLIIASVLFYAGYRALMDALRTNAFYFGSLRLPEWPGKLAFFVGYAVFTLRLLDLLFLDTYARLRAKRQNQRIE